MRVLICGSRDWSKPIPIDVVVGGFAAVYGAANVTVIHGAARGADSMAASAAHRHGIDCEDYPAAWATDGKAAGPIRNQRMLDEGKPEVVVAFSDDLATSRCVVRLDCLEYSLANGEKWGIWVGLSERERRRVRSQRSRSARGSAA